MKLHQNDCHTDNHEALAHAYSMKQKPKAAPAPGDKDLGLKLLVDEFAALDGEVDRFDAKMKRWEALRKQILGLVTAKPEDEQPFSGNVFIVVATPCGEQERIADLAALRKALGAKYAEIAKPTVAAAKAALAASLHAKHFVTARTGPRRLRVEARPGL